MIAAAGLVASMDVRPVRLRRPQRRLSDRLPQEGFEGVPVSAECARRALPKARRHEVSRDEIADALDQPVAAGLADRASETP